MTTQQQVIPRRPGDPQVDHTPVLLTHRAMLTDAARLTALLTDLAQTRAPIETRRAAAIRDHLVALGTELHEHHSREDDIAWPVIAASAGAAVDLTPLTEDHTTLAPLIDTMVTAARAFATDPTGQVGPLAHSMRELSELLHEHIPEEERDVLPVISRYVSVPDWEAVEHKMRAGMSLRHLAWLMPRMERFATPQELAQVLDKDGWVCRLLLTLTRRRYHRHEQLIFGSGSGRHI